MFETFTYEHPCGKKFSVRQDEYAFADLLPDELKTEPPIKPEQISGKTKPVKEYFAELARAKGSMFVDPKETPLFFCRCGKWIDFEQVLKDHKMKQKSDNLLR
jgi:hypothetical protein